MGRDRWKPILRGNIYCAPACGGGCTKAAYDSAVKSAEDLVQRLKGSGWTVQVHENLGWHYTAVSGPVQVYPSGDGRFHCMIGSDLPASPGGCGLWTPQPGHYSKDPNRAVRLALQYVYPVVQNFQAVLVAAEKAAGIQSTNPSGGVDEQDKNSV